MSDPVRLLSDRLAIQDLAARYARGVDRRDFELLDTVFTRDARLAVHYGDPAKVEPRNDMRGAAQILKGMRTILRYRATTHFIGNQTMSLEGDQARGETYCLAHHIHEQDGRWLDYVMSIRYADHCVRDSGVWRFAERVLAVDWTEERPVEPLA
jgi:SnoaL-like protein